MCAFTRSAESEVAEAEEDDEDADEDEVVVCEARRAGGFGVVAGVGGGWGRCADVGYLSVG